LADKTWPTRLGRQDFTDTNLPTLTVPAGTSPTNTRRPIPADQDFADKDFADLGWLAKPYSEHARHRQLPQQFDNPSLLLLNRYRCQGTGRRHRRKSPVEDT
jgi:hypothetical protein